MWEWAQSLSVSLGAAHPGAWLWVPFFICWSLTQPPLQVSLPRWSGLHTGAEPQWWPSSPVTTSEPQTAGDPRLLHARLAHSSPPSPSPPPSCTPGRCGLVPLTSQGCLLLDQGRQAKHFTTNPRGHTNSHGSWAEVHRQQSVIQRSPKGTDLLLGEARDNQSVGVRKEMSELPFVFIFSSFFYISTSLISFILALMY